MEIEYPFSTERSSLLGTEAFRNLLGTSLKNAKISVVILSAYVKEVGIKWIRSKLQTPKLNVLLWQDGMRVTLFKILQI